MDKKMSRIVVSGIAVQRFSDFEKFSMKSKVLIVFENTEPMNRWSGKIEKSIERSEEEGEREEEAESDRAGGGRSEEGTRRSISCKTID